MSIEAVLGLWADAMVLSVVIWLVLVVTVLYAGRRWIAPLATALFQGVDHLLRLSARSVRAAARHVDKRQRAYLRTLERERLDHQLYRELHGLHDRVNRDLGGYPVLQRAMHEQIQRLEQDYHAAEELPPAEPPWLRTVAELAKNQPHGDPAVARVLEDIHDGLQRAGRAAQDEYHAASRERLELLRAMLPAWRALGERLNAVEHAIQRVVSRSRQVDEIVGRHEALAQGGAEIDAGLVAGSVGRLLVNGTLLALAALAAVVSFHLIERPMAEAVGLADHIGPWPLSALASGLLILLAVATGLLMTETRHLTRLVPGLGNVDPGVRRWLFGAGLLMLLVVAGLQGALAFSREFLMAQDERLTLMMTLEPDVSATMVQWIPVLTQMGMGFILPLLVALAAVPLESFLRHLRVVLGVILAVALRLLAFLLGFLARLVRWAASLVRVIYGLLIFVPVTIEQRVREKSSGREPGEREA